MYILLIIILISIIYKKYTDFKDKYLNIQENYEKMNLRESGIKIEVPIYKKYNIGSGEFDGIYFNIANALGNLHGINMGVVQTEGSIMNLEKVEKGEIEFGIVQEDILLNKVLLSGDNNLKNIRFVSGLHNELYFLIVKKNSNINSFTNLKNGFNIIGKNYIIGTGKEKSGSLDTLKLLCKIYNINLIRLDLDNRSNTDIDYRQNNLFYVDKNINDNLNLFRKGVIHALFYVSGPKISYIINLSKYIPIKFLEFNSNQIILNNIVSNKGIKDKMLKIKDNTSSLNNYSDNDINTKSIRSVLICNKNLDEEFVYSYLKKIFNNLSYLKMYMFNDSYSNEFKPLEMFNINENIKMHSGANKFYKEINFINDGSNKDCEYNNIFKSCNLSPSLNLKKIYWKYDKIPFLLNQFERE